MIRCPKCLKAIPCNCSYLLKYKNSILQLTDLANMDLIDEDKYIGYDHIGEYYSNNFEVENIDLKICKSIKEHVKDGVLLDLGCGDGVYTIPLLMNNVKVIAGDISNKMMGLLLEKVECLKLDKSLLTLVRMNAYDIPIIDNSISAVIANSMLHLNSNPQKIIQEIYRVLKPNGLFICFEDSPGRKEINKEFDNSKYLLYTDEFYQRYWKYLKELNYFPVKYSWKFDRNSYCLPLFSSFKEIIIKEDDLAKTVNLYDGFYRRMKGKGFSDQSAVPDEIHKLVFDKVDKELRVEFGSDYLSCEFKYYANNKIIKMYIK